MFFEFNASWCNTPDSAHHQAAQSTLMTKIKKSSKHIYLSIRKDTSAKRDVFLMLIKITKINTHFDPFIFNGLPLCCSDLPPFQILLHPPPPSPPHKTFFSTVWKLQGELRTSIKKHRWPKHKMVCYGQNIKNMNERFLLFA